MTLNMLAVGIVVLNIAVALSIYFIDGGIDLPMMVGILYGAVTNTPGLGAAQEALNQLSYTGDPIALGYACAYPLGVVGIIGSIIAVRYICRVNLKKEEDELAVQTSDMKHMPHMLHLEVRNESIDGKSSSRSRSLWDVLLYAHASVTRDTSASLTKTLNSILATRYLLYVPKKTLKQ